MKILHVVPYYPPAYAFGGPPKIVEELAKKQSSLGHEVTVLTTNAYQPKTNLPTGVSYEHGVEVVRLMNLSRTLIWKLHFCTPLGVRDFFQKHSFDVIHLHEVRTILNYLTLRYGKARSFFLSPWGTLPYNQSLTLPKKLMDVLLLPLLRKKIQTTVAQTNHEMIVSKYFHLSKNYRMIPLSVNKKEFSDLPSKKDARLKLGLEKNTFYFLFLGRFSPQKGVGDIIKIFLENTVNMPNAKLLLVGRDDGGLKDIEKELHTKEAYEKVIVHPPLYDKDRLLAYAAADVFLFNPTVYEETSTACLEALACKLPVITNKRAEIPYMNPMNGVLTWPLYGHKKSTILLQSYANPPKVNLNFFWERYDIAQNAERFLDEYQQSL